MIWSPRETRYHDVVLGGPLIDAQRNMIVISVTGVHKLSPDGKHLWSTSLGGQMMMQVGSLSPDGSRYYHVDFLGTAYALDTATGEVAWKKETPGSMSIDTAYVENHDGVVIFQKCQAWSGCNASDSVFAVSAKDGELLWTFKTDTPVWNLMPMFPEDDTMVFQDYDGKAYRLGLHNGSLIWKAGGGRGHGGAQSWTDGGTILGNDGRVYSVSSKAFVTSHYPTSGGGVHVYDLKDGRLIWEKDVERPFFTWPAVGRLAGRSDRSVIVALGANGYPPWNVLILLLGPLLLAVGVALALLVHCCCSCRGGCRKLATRAAVGAVGGLALTAILVLVYLSGIFIPMGFFKADVYALNAETGEQQWVFRVPDWNHRYSAGDWEGFYQRSTAIPQRPFCLPAAYNSPTIDAAGTVYIGYMDGAIYGLRDVNGDGVVEGDEEVWRWDTGGAFLHSGAAIVPGMMAVTSCDMLYVWKL